MSQERPQFEACLESFKFYGQVAQWQIFAKRLLSYFKKWINAIDILHLKRDNTIVSNSEAYTYSKLKRTNTTQKVFGVQSQDVMHMSTFWHNEIVEKLGSSPSISRQSSRWWCWWRSSIRSIWSPPPRTRMANATSVNTIRFHSIIPPSFIARRSLRCVISFPRVQSSSHLHRAHWGHGHPTRRI